MINKASVCQEQKKDSVHAYQLFEEALTIKNNKETKFSLLKESLLEAENKELLFLQSKIHTYLAVYYISKLDSSNIFKHLNKTKSIYQTLNTKGKLQALLLLDYAYAYQQLKNYDESIFFAEQAIGLTNNQETKAKTYNSIGVAYLSLGDYEEALKQFYMAKAIKSEEKSLTLESQINQNIGIVHFRLKDYLKALEYLNIASEQKQESKDLKGQMRTVINIGNVYALQNKHSNAHEYYQNALHIAKSINDNVAIPAILLNLGYIASKEGHHQNAIKYYQNALESSLTENNSVVYNNLGGEYMTLDNLNAAFFNYTKAYQNATKNKELEHIKSSSLSLSYYYRHIKEFKKALEYHHIYSQAKDSLLNTELIKRIENIKHKHEKELNLSQIKLLKKSNELKEFKLIRNKKINLALVASTLLLVLLILLLIRKSKSNKRNSQALIKQQELLHQKEKEILRVKQEKLTNELSAKNIQLTNHIIQASEKNEFIESLISNLDLIKTDLNLKKTKEINFVIHELKQNSNDNIWQEFDVMFNEIQHGFYEKLHETFPELSAAERRLCAFLRMDMSTKEIAHITHKSAAGIDTARSRLRKKLNISDSSIILSDFIRQITS